jgi:hypothetical protein
MAPSNSTVNPTKNKRHRLLFNPQLWQKLGESYLSVFPIVLVVTILYFTKLIPEFSGESFVAFLCCAFFIGGGLSLFTAGADQSMSRIGTIIGETLFKQRKMWLIVLMTFLIGVLVTVAEPDLKVMASQIGWNVYTLIISIGLGVGLFVVFGVLRIIFNKSLNVMFLGFYGIVFALAAIVNPKFLPISFDSGGVTTGPVTVPFILAFGAGLAASRNSNGRSGEDAFGLTALASVGPIITVMLMSTFLDVDSMSFPWNPSQIVTYSSWEGFAGEFFTLLGIGVLGQLKDVAIAIVPLALFFVIYNLLFVHLSFKAVLKIMIGLIYAYLGLVVFLTAVNVGFLPVAQEVGYQLGVDSLSNLAILIGGFFALFGVLAEPAVHVLVQQIETISEGTIKSKSVLAVMALSIGAGVALAVLRAELNFSILYYMIPGYFIALSLTFMVPKIYTSIAFDSGGVASGPMASTFVMPFCTGYAYGVAEGKGAALGLSGSDLSSYISNYVFEDAFGSVAMIALMPLIVIQLMGLYAEIKRDIINKRVRKKFVEANDLQVIHFGGVS